MKAFKNIFLSSLLLLTSNLIAQFDSDNFIGTWVLKKHFFAEKGTPKDIMDNKRELIYEFNKNGTYTQTSSYTWEGKKDTWVCKGKWKLTGKTITFSNNKFLPPNDQYNSTLTTWALEAISISNNLLIIQENLMETVKPGKSHYVKK